MELRGRTWFFPGFCIPFAILYLQPTVTIKRNLLLGCGDKRRQIKAKSARMCAFLNRNYFFSFEEWLDFSEARAIVFSTISEYVFNNWIIVLPNS